MATRMRSYVQWMTRCLHDNALRGYCKKLTTFFMMANAVATALNAFMHETVRLSPRDEENMQAFITDFFTSPEVDSDEELTGLYNEYYH